MYLSWAAFYEGRTDSSYFNILIPRLLEEVLMKEGVRPYDVGLTPSVEFGLSGRSFSEVAVDICGRREEYHVLFIHADTGGRSLESGISGRREALVKEAEELCNFDAATAILLSPRKELEAWAVADSNAVQLAFGLTTLPEGVLPASPAEAERVDDPKLVLQEISRQINRRRRTHAIPLVRIAQEQSFNTLRLAPSFQEFEASLKRALRHIGCIRA